jgi:NTP pyrophosphatase (non-canonical NTP hydrolase)
MSNEFQALNALADYVYDIAASKGWHDAPVEMSTSCSNIHAEVSELWEAYRNGALSEPCSKAEGMTSLGLRALTCQEEELADIIIRALDTSTESGIDIGEAVRIKSLYNVSRPRMHGGKKA